MPIFCRFAILLLTIAASFPPAIARAASSDVPKSPPRFARTTSRSHPGGIQRLIDQLGSEQYFLRRHAEEQLIERGADVFDQLQLAEEHPDLEIATRAHYILQRIRIEWIHPHDSAEVQAAMHNYGDLSKSERLQRMDQLIALANDDGLGALCRIARFEPSGQLARGAAFKVMRSDSLPKGVSERVAMIRQELGDSRRAPVEWLRTYGKQLEQPERVFDRWLTLIDEEVARLAEDSAETNVLFVFRFLSFHLELCRNSPRPADVFSNLNRHIELSSQSDVQVRQLFDVLSQVRLLSRSDLQFRQMFTVLSQQIFAALSQQITYTEFTEFLGPAQVAGWLLDEDAGEIFGLAYAMNWLWENDQWEALELLEDHYGKTIRQERLLVYLAAAARWKQGRDELAEEFAERAYKMEAGDDADRADIGDLIGEMGRHDWAEREWWFVVETVPVVDANSVPNSNSISARRSLALLRLHDRGEDRRAAEMMAEVSDALEADPKLKRNLMRDANGRYLLNQLHAQQDYFLASQAAAEGKQEAQRKYLESACVRDPQDLDVLIAMYRVKDADEAFRKQTVVRIQKAVRTVEGFIEKQPDNAQWHNHWAWLVSNTEGDYAQAVKHSLRSLELSPDSPSYLDTLGRCYYAVGELENAVRVQREAVQRHPHLQVMRNQLKLFELALAELKSKRE